MRYTVSAIRLLPRAACVVFLNYLHIKSTKFEPGRPRFGAVYSPPCITARRGGRAINNNVAKPPLTRGRGGFPIENKRKTTPAASAAMAARHFIEDAATPACGDARRGITPDFNFS